MQSAIADHVLPTFEQILNRSIVDAADRHMKGGNRSFRDARTHGQAVSGVKQYGRISFLRGDIRTNSLCYIFLVNVDESSRTFSDAFSGRVVCALRMQKKQLGCSDVSLQPSELLLPIASSFSRSSAPQVYDQKYGYKPLRCQPVSHNYGDFLR